MRTLNIGFIDGETIYLDGTRNAGQQGEHLATQLIIALPNELLTSNPDYYIVSFRRFSNEEIYCSQAITTGGYSDVAYFRDNKIFIKIPIEATANAGCFVVVEGHKNSSNSITEAIKSPRIKLEFYESNTGDIKLELSKLPSPLTIAQKGISVDTAVIDVDSNLTLTMSDHTTKICGKTSPDIIDNLTSTSIKNSLSANQGKALDSKKVDKEFKTGSSTDYKVLSDNNYTNGEKDKLANSASAPIIINTKPTLSTVGKVGQHLLSILTGSNEAIEYICTDANTSTNEYTWKVVGGAVAKSLTLSEYNALPQVEKDSDTMFLITDGEASVMAEDIPYTNTGSGLVATKVQGAIDALKSLFDNFKTQHTATPTMYYPTLGANWINWGDPYYTTRYWKDSHNVVHIDAMVKAVGARTTAIFTLPVGFRPLKNYTFPAIINGSVATNAYIQSDGQVNASIANDGYVWINTQFLAEG